MSLPGSKASLRLVDLLNAANRGYSDGYLSMYYDLETGKFDETATGDSLARFVALEIIETFDPEASSEEQFEEARRVINNGIKDLYNVLVGLDEDENERAS